jgi:Cd2+/Zn2+-exporting ATPase
VHTEAVFHVDGLDCNDEVVLLERCLGPIEGVEALSADVMSQRLRISYDAARVSTEALVSAAAVSGLRMWLEHERPVADVSGERRRNWLLGAAAAGVSGAGLATAAGWPAGVAVLGLGAILVGIVEPARRAAGAVRAGVLDINTLMVFAVVGAVALGEWLEGAGVVFLFAASQWLEGRALARARHSIAAMLNVAPREALVRRHDGEARVPVASLRAGEVVIVRPGDRMPVDGTVVAGTTEVNEAALTGESWPVAKAVGAEVLAGTMNGGGSVDVRVVRVGADTRLAHITHLVEQAQSRRAPIQAFVDRFGRRYTPLVAVAALLVGVVPLLAGGDPTTWIYRGLVLLVVACPCALVVSTPVAMVAAMAASARQGVLIKGGAVLERLATFDALALDKTGTLTLGRASVADVEPFGPFTTDDVLRLAASVEARSGHPLAQAIVRGAAVRGLSWPTSDAFLSAPGGGAAARVETRRVAVGSRQFLVDRGVEVPRPGALDSARDGSLVYVGVDGTLAGMLTLVDEPRQHAAESVARLKALGVRRVVLLTGDRASVASPVATAIAADECRADLSPEAKHGAVESLRAAGYSVAMVGDGINDGPALAAADVGIAMGAVGSDVALETADVALMSDDLLTFPDAVSLARSAMRTVRVNIALSLGLKAIFLAAAVLGWATLWMAVVADTGATVLVVANSMRLLRPSGRSTQGARSRR